MFGIKSLPLHNLSSHSEASFQLGFKIFPSPMTIIGDIITATDSDIFLLWMLKYYSGVRASYNCFTQIYKTRIELKFNH